MTSSINVGLVDVDGHNFPNLALMKISAYHRERGDGVELATMFGRYDIIYKSKVFTWTQDDEYCYNCETYISGGSGYGNYKLLDDDIDGICPDYSLYGCQHAYGFLTRGCIRNCPWCIVPQKEGEIRANADIQDFIGGMDSAVLMDNNVLAHPHGIAQIEKIKKMKIKIDFNQGLDARLIDRNIAKLLSGVRWLSPVRLACDSQGMKKHVQKAVSLMREARVTPKNYFCYVLVDDIEDAFDRVEFLRSLSVDPFAQAYRRNTGEPTQEQKDFCRWVNHKAIFKSVPWENYQ